MAEVIEIASLEIDIDAVLKESGRLKKSIDELKKANKELDRSTEEGAKQFAKNEAELRNLNKAFRDNQKFAAAVIKSNKDLERTLSAEGKTTLELLDSRRQLREISKSVRGDTQEEIALRKQLNDAIDAQTEAIRDQSSEFDTGKDSIGEYADGIQEAAGNLNPFRNGIKGSIAALKQLTRSALAFIATPLGATIAALAGIALITKGFLNYNKAIRETSELTEQLTNTTGELAASIRIRSQAITGVFRTSFEENIKAARTLVNEFGISFDEAFDTIEKGLIQGGKANDDFLNQLKEFPTFFAQAGFSAEEFINIINAGSDLSFFNDTLPNAIKESAIQLNEQTQSTRDALENAFGTQFTDQLFGNIEDGSITVINALGEIAKASENVQLNVQQQAQLTADLFKGAGEDAGGALKIFEALNIALNEENVALTTLEEALLRQIELEKQLGIEKDNALRSDTIIGLTREFENLGTFLQTQFFVALQGIGKVFNRVTDNLVAGVISVITRIKTLNQGFRESARLAREAFDRVIRERRESREAAIELERQERTREKAASDSLLARQRSEAEAKRAAAAAKQRAAAARKISEERLEDFEKEIRIFQEQSQIRLDTSLAARQLERRQENDILDKKIAEGLIKEKDARLERLRIENEFQAAKAEIETQELARIETFENEKRTLENELALLRAEDDLARAELALQQEFDSQIRALERSEINEEEKTQLLALLEAQRAITLQGIRDDAADKELDADKKLLEAKKAARLQEIDDQQMAFNAATELARNFFGENKALQSALTLIDTFFAAQRAYASQLIPGDPTSLGRAIGAAIFSVSQGLARVAQINGISFAAGGILDGPSHAQGGIDTPFGNMQGGEAVINKKSTSLFRPLLSRINQAGGGRSFQGGGITGAGISNISNQIASATANTPLIDLDRLAGVLVTAVEALPSPQVSVKEIQTVNTKVQAIEDTATV